MSCELVKVAISNEQRKAFSTMFARLVLHRMGEVQQDTKSSWENPKCCSLYGKDKDPIPFSDFLQGVKKIRLNTETKSAIKELSQQILSEETNIPSPVLQSIRIGEDSFQFSKEKPPQDKVTFAKVLTRLFYLSDHPETENDLKILEKVWTESSNEALYLKAYFSVTYFLTLLSRQNWCPHFSNFSAFFTCYADVACKESKKNKKALTYVHLYELPQQTVISWLHEPTKGAGAKDLEIELFKIRRPVLLEIENLLFQIVFTFYTLSVFNIRFLSDDIEEPTFEKLFRLFTCQKVAGYDRYRTLEHVYYVPNYGNFFLFTLSNADSKILYSLQFGQADDTIRKDNVVKPLLKLIQLIQDEVQKWTEQKHTDIPLVNQEETRFPYEFSVKSSNEQEQNMEPTRLIVNQKNQILEYLAEFLAKLEPWSKSTDETKTSNYQDIYEEILQQNFPSYQQVSSHTEQDVTDLTLINDYGFNLQSRHQLYVTPFVTEIIFQDYKGNEKLDFNPLALMKVSDSKSDIIVDPEVLSIAISLQSRTGSGGMHLLLGNLKEKLGKFLTDNAFSETAISDRYMVDASQLSKRKILRKYGISFLTLLSSLNQPGRSPIRSDWINLFRMSDLFSNASNYMSAKDPVIRSALENLLKVKQPNDLSKFLSTLMFLTYLQGFQPKEEKKSPVSGTPALTEEQLQKKWIKEWSELVGIPKADIKANLEWIKNQHRLPTDVRSELGYLMEKLSQMIRKPHTQGRLSKSQDTLAESSKQKAAYTLLQKQFVQKIKAGSGGPSSGASGSASILP